MTDYRFSLQRPGRRLRPAFGLMPTYAPSLIRPLPSVIGPWSEPSYTEQTREYAASRMPTFTRKLDSVVAETERLIALYGSRVAAGTVQGSGEQAFVSMPVSGECPRNGPLAYVYEDIFAAAQTNLATLGGERPPRWSPVSEIARWATTIWTNIEILQKASNIDERFLFPDTVRRSTGAANYAEFSGGSRRTLRTSANAPKEGHPYPQDGPRVPQAFIDAEETIDRNFVQTLRLTPGVSLAPDVCNTAARTEAECSASILARKDRIWFGLSAAPFEAGISDVRLRPQKMGLTPLTLELLEKVFFTTVDDLRGSIRFGSPVASVAIGGAWDKLYSPVFMRSRPGEQIWDYTTSRYIPYTGWRILNPIGMIDRLQRVATTFSRVSLQQIVADAIGFYVFNHNVWYAEKLGFTPEQLREQQRAVASAGLDRTSAPILGVVGAVGSAVNPAIGIVIGIVNAIGKELLLSFIQVRPDIPKPLFLRVPDPNVCEGRPEDQAGASLCPEGTTGVYPRCVPITLPEPQSSVSPLAVGGALAAGLLLLFAVKKRKKT